MIIKYFFHRNIHLHLHIPLSDVVNPIESQFWRNKFLLSEANVPILILTDAVGLTDGH